jgi:hypothetical protein
MGYTKFMSRNPFVQTKDQSTEFGFGAGHFPDPNIDFSDNGIRSGIPIADPDRSQQYLDLMAAKRTDLGRPDVRDMPGFLGTHADHEDYHSLGNTERYGANPPLVRAKGYPPRKKYKFTPRAHMEREF